MWEASGAGWRVLVGHGETWSEAPTSVSLGSWAFSHQALPSRAGQSLPQSERAPQGQHQEILFPRTEPRALDADPEAGLWAGPWLWWCFPVAPQGQKLMLASLASVLGVEERKG